MSRDPQLYLRDIQESCRRIREYTKGMDRHKFLADEKTVDAVIRNHEVIGEAAKKLPAEVTDRESGIP